MIGVSSGIAPFLGFMEERSRLKAHNNTVFFGCMQRTQDLLYGEELAAWERDGVVDLHLAFSHDQKELVFVQHLMVQQAERLFDLMENGAHIFVCGHTKMGQGVEAAIREIVLKGMRNDQLAAEKYVDKLFETGRLKTDVFS